MKKLTETVFFMDFYPVRQTHWWYLEQKLPRMGCYLRYDRKKYPREPSSKRTRMNLTGFNLKKEELWRKKTFSWQKNSKYALIATQDT